MPAQKRGNLNTSHTLSFDAAPMGIRVAAFAFAFACAARAARAAIISISASFDNPLDFSSNRCLFRVSFLISRESAMRSCNSCRRRVFIVATRSALASPTSSRNARASTARGEASPSLSIRSKRNSNANNTVATYCCKTNKLAPANLVMQYSQICKLILYPRWMLPTCQHAARQSNNMRAKNRQEPCAHWGAPGIWPYGMNAVLASTTNLQSEQSINLPRGRTLLRADTSALVCASPARLLRLRILEACGLTQLLAILASLRA